MGGCKKEVINIEPYIDTNVLDMWEPDVCYITLSGDVAVFNVTGLLTAPAKTLTVATSEVLPVKTFAQHQYLSVHHGGDKFYDVRAWLDINGNFCFWTYTDVSKLDVFITGAAIMQ